MIDDTQCPYCGAEIGINHDDGQGYEQDRLHQQDCNSCKKTFTFYTVISFDYYANKADCLNGGEHIYKASHTAPKECTHMFCTMCDNTRKPTEDEWKEILK